MSFLVYNDVFNKLLQKSKLTSAGSFRKFKSLKILLLYGIGQLNW